MTRDHEALIVGGAAAGLSAALVLGRARVNTLAVDAGEPSNRQASSIGGLLGQDRVSPSALYDAGREQIAELPSVELRGGTVTAIEALDGDAPAFRAELADGTEVIVSRVLLAGGMHYDTPDVPGVAELWGDSVFMCPYCHGWEHRDQRIAILGGDGASERVRLLGSWSQDLIVLANGEVGDQERESLDELSAEFDERNVSSVGATSVTFADGGQIEVDAVHVIAPMVPRDGLIDALALGTVDNGPWVAAERFGATSVDGVFAAGDIANAGNVAASIAGGSLAATGLHRSLIF